MNRKDSKNITLTGIGYKTIWNGHEVTFEYGDIATQKAFEHAVLKDVMNYEHPVAESAPSTPIGSSPGGRKLDSAAPT